MDVRRSAASPATSRCRPRSAQQRGSRTATDASPGKPRGPVRRSLTSALSTLPRKIVAAATGIATLAGLLFLLVPGLQPRVEHCRETAEGNLSQIRVEQGTYRDYLLMSDRPLSGRSTQELKLPGDILFYKAVIQGFKDRPIAVRWSLLSRTHDRLIDNPILNNDLPVLTFTSDRCSSDQFGQPIWINAGVEPGKQLYAEVLLYDVRRKLLVESARSPAFTSPNLPSG